MKKYRLMLADTMYGCTAYGVVGYYDTIDEAQEDFLRLSDDTPDGSYYYVERWDEDYNQWTGTFLPYEIEYYAHLDEIANDVLPF